VSELAPGSDPELEKIQEATRNLDSLAEVHKLHRSIADMHKALKVMEAMASQAEGEVQAPEGYIFEVQLLAETQAYRFDEPDPHYAAGPSYGNLPDKTPPTYGRNRPFLANRVLANYNGYFFVNNDTGHCVVINRGHKDYGYVEDFPSTLARLVPITDLENPQAQ
jgi:hypothetical protein